MDSSISAVARVEAKRKDSRMNRCFIDYITVDVSDKFDGRATTSERAAVVLSFVAARPEVVALTNIVISIYI